MAVVTAALMFRSAVAFESAALLAGGVLCVLLSVTLLWVSDWRCRQLEVAQPPAPSAGVLQLVVGSVMVAGGCVVLQCICAVRP